MFRFLLIAGLTWPLSGCALFNFKSTIISQEVKAVAAHNISMVELCDIVPRNYLSVDKDFNTRPQNLFFYINDINKDLSRTQVCLKSIVAYNNDIIKGLKN